MQRKTTSKITAILGKAMMPRPTVRGVGPVVIAPARPMYFSTQLHRISQPYLSSKARTFSSEIKSNEREDKGFVVRLFNPKDPSHIKVLNAIIDAETVRTDKENQPLKLTYSKMVDWLKKYVNSPEFLKLYNQHSLELMAEATFWSVQLGLEPLLAKMSYTEIRKFQPLAEGNFVENKTERTEFIDDVCKKLTKPAMSYEASYALGQAAWCVYIHNHSFEKLQEEEKLYDSAQTITRKIRRK